MLWPEAKLCPPHLCARLFRTVADLSREVPDELRHTLPPTLTMRQEQLLSLVAKGLTNKEIASQLHLSEFTVKDHMHRIMQKLGAGTRGEAVERVRSSSHAALT